MNKPNPGDAVNFRPAIDDNLRNGTKSIAGTVDAVEQRDGKSYVDVSLTGGDIRCGVLFVGSVEDDNGAYVTSTVISAAELQLAEDQAAASALAAKIADEKAAAEAQS